MGHDYDSVVWTVLVEKKGKTKAISDMICELMWTVHIFEVVGKPQKKFGEFWGIGHRGPR